MNLLKRLFGAPVKKYLTPQQGINIRFFGGQIVPYADQKEVYVDKGYRGNDIVYSIISLIRETAKVAPWGWYKIVDQEAYKKYKNLIAQVQASGNMQPQKGQVARNGQDKRQEEKLWRDIFSLRAKALELYTSNEQLNTLILYPNPNQTFAELNGELWTWKLVTGDYFEYWEGTPSGGLNQGIPKSLSALPSHCMVIRSSNTLPLTAEKYYLQLGQMVEFDKELILHEKYPNLKWDTFGIQLYGMSPLQPGLPRLQRNNNSQIAGAVAAETGGQRMVAFYNDPRLDPNDDKTFEQMSKERKTFQNEMKPGVQGANHVFWSQYAVGTAPIGFSPRELQLSETEMADLRQFCADYGVPSQLLNDSAAKTYNTVTEAEKALITRAVLPLLCARRESLNRKFARTDNVVLDFDLTVYDQLQPNKDQIATWINKMPLTNSRKLEIIGEDIPETMTQEERDAILIPSGFVSLKDVIMPPEDNMDGDEDQLNAAGANPYNENQ